jgi:HEAT repeat protein
MERHMKLKIHWIAVAVLMLGGLARAQSLDETLAKFPARHGDDERALCADIVKAGALGDLCKKIVPAGSADDTRARYAIAAMTRYAGRAGADAERLSYAKALLEALTSNPDPEPKALFMQQLQFLGRDEAVEPLAKYLLDENVNLSQSAADALIAIKSPAASAAINQALTSASPDRLAILLHAAAELRIQEAAEIIRKNCSSEDPAIRHQALYAAARVPLPDAGAIFSKMIQAAANASERGQAVSLELLFARGRAESGHTDEAATICRDLIKSQEQDASVRSAALATLVQIVHDQALPDVLAAAESLNSEYRNAALELAARIPGPAATEKWVQKAGQGEPEVRIDVIAMLGRRQDPAAVPALVSSLSDKDATVRAAAIPALAKLAGPAAIPELLKFLAEAKGLEVQSAVDALSRMPGEGVLSAAATALPTVSPASRVALLDMLGNRGASSQRAVILAQAQSGEEPVRLAALRAMARVADEKDLPALVKLAADAKSDTEESAALKAVAATSASADVRAKALVDALPSTHDAKHAAFLRALAKIGGEAATNAVVADLKTPATFDAAVRALSDSADPSALPHLLAVAKDDKTDTAHYVLALRGAVNLAKSTSFSEAQRVEHLKEALAACRRAEEKKLVLSALSNERTVEALDAIAPSLDDVDLKQEASLASVRLILPQKQGQRPLRGPTVRPILEKALLGCPDAKLKQQGSQYLGTLAK